MFPKVAIDVARVVQKSSSLPVGSKSIKNTCDSVHVLVSCMLKIGNITKIDFFYR